jgi:hypothetical protein
MPKLSRRRRICVSLDAEGSSKYGLKITEPSAEEDILNELNRFDINKISDLSKLLTDKFLSEYREINRSTTGIGFLRDLMMYADIDKYFF